MDGLSAASGVAGLMSLAVQLGDSVIKLKRLYSSLRDAPANLEAVTTQLTIMDLHFRQLLNRRTLAPAFHDDACFIDFLVHKTSASVQKIYNIVRTLEDTMAKSKIKGRISMSMKESEIKSLWDIVESEKTSLILACQLHDSMLAKTERLEQIRLLEAMMRRLDDQEQHMKSLDRGLGHKLRMEAPSTEPQINITAPPLKYGRAVQKDSSPRLREYEPSQERLSKVHRRAGQNLWVLRLVASFVSRTWQITLATSEMGWTVQLQTRRVVPQTSDVFEMCKRRSATGMRKLLETGKASILDEDEQGKSVIDHALYQLWIAPQNDIHEAEACSLVEFLLARYKTLRGQDMLLKTAFLAWNSVHWTDYEKLSPCAMNLIHQLRSYGLDIWDLVEYCSCPGSYDVIGSGLWPFQLTLLQDDTFDYEKITLDQRFGLAMQLSDCWPSDFLEMCGVSAVTPEIAALSRSDGETVLHRAALFFALSYDHPSSHEREVNSEWGKMIVELLVQGADVCALWHHADSEGHDDAVATEQRETPLMVYARYMFRPDIQPWASILRAAGVNLVRYSVKELGFWERSQTKFSSVYTVALKSLSMSNKGNILNNAHATWTRNIIPLYVLQCTPGSYPRPMMPSKICWVPNNEEKVDGCWVFDGSTSLRPEEFATMASHISLEWSDRSSCKVFETWHDDASIISLSHSRARNSIRRIRPRSQSAPRNIPERYSHQFDCRDADTSFPLPYHRCLGTGTFTLGNSCAATFRYEKTRHTDFYSEDYRPCALAHPELCFDLNFYRELARNFRLDHEAGLLHGDRRRRDRIAC